MVKYKSLIISLGLTTAVLSSCGFSSTSETTTTTTTIPAADEYLGNDWKCKNLIGLTVWKETTLEEIAEKLIVSGNCEGLEGLLHYLRERYGNTIYPGEQIAITSYGSGK